MKRLFYPCSPCRVCAGRRQSPSLPPWPPAAAPLRHPPPSAGRGGTDRRPRRGRCGGPSTPPSRLADASAPLSRGEQRRQTPAPGGAPSSAAAPSSTRGAQSRPRRRTNLDRGPILRAPAGTQVPTPPGRARAAGTQVRRLAQAVAGGSRERWLAASAASGGGRDLGLGGVAGDRKSVV